MQRYNARQFLWDAARKTCCVEISELGSDFNPHMIVRVFNPRSGDETQWVHKRDIRDNERELVGWALQPTSKTVDLFPHMTAWEMTVFND